MNGNGRERKGTERSKRAGKGSSRRQKVVSRSRKEGESRTKRKDTETARECGWQRNERSGREGKEKGREYA